MKKTTVLTALLAVLAVTAGLLWPGRVLARRERRLYGQIVTGAAAVSAFERGETTLAQRIAVLGSINNTVPAMDFSAGAQLYDDEYTLRRRFVRELRQMGEFFAPASDLEAWLVETEMATQEFHEIPVSYRCAVDPDSGKTFLVGTLQDLNWEQFLLYMDMSSGKIISGEFQAEEQEVSGEQGWILASGLANYLGLTPVTCLESDSTGGVYLFESENQEQRLYGRKTAQDVLSPQFAADTGTLFQRLNTLAQYHQVTYLSLQAGSDLYYDQETLLELYRQELSTLAQTNELAASLLPALEDLLERQRLYQDALEVGYACVVDLSTGNSFLVSYLRSNDLVFALEMDMSSGKLIQLCSIAELCENPERVREAPWDCATSLAQYLGLTCTAESDQGWAVQYTFLDPEGDGSVLTFQLRLDDLLQLSVTPNEFFLSSP